MKIKAIFILFFFTLFFSAECRTQSINANSSSNRTGTYTVKKKKETIASIAKKLKVEPLVLAELNNIASVEQVLQKGEMIKVPVSPGTNTAAAQVAHEQNQPPLSSADSLAKATAKNYSLEIQKNRLLLIDATLELNEALMQGVQVSLDSLNKEEEEAANEKNAQTARYKMQLLHDKSVIKPYLIHFQDSLGKAIVALKQEKEHIERGMNDSELQEARADTVATAINKTESSAPVADESVKEETATIIPVKKDTIAAVSTQTETNINEPSLENSEAVLAHLTPVPIPRDITSKQEEVKPVTESDTTPVQPVKAPVHWKTARALEPIPENSFPRDVMEMIAEEKENTTPPVVSGDTDAYVPHVAKNNGTGNKANRPLELDTIDHLKAELFLTKGLTAMNDKRYTDAEQYLKKAIDLEQYYYDAWLALADVHVAMGLYAEGYNEYKICEKLSPGGMKLYAKMGQAAAKLKMQDEAFKYYQKALQIDSDYIPAIEGRAVIFAERKHYDTAIAEYNRVLLINRGHHYTYKLRGIAEYLSKDYEAAIDDLTRFLIFEEKDPASHYYRGLAKIAHNEAEDGCTDLSIAAKLGYAAASKMIQKNCGSRK